MSVKLVLEQNLHEVLRPYRVEGNAFEAGVRARIQAGQQADQAEQAPLLRVAAAFLPWPLVAQGNLVGSGVNFSSLPLGQKLLGFMALPAISLFCLVGAAFFSVTKIRTFQKGNHPDIGDAEEMQAAVRQWWGCHKWTAWLVFAAVLIVPMIGSTWLLFLLLLVSFGSLLALLSSLAKLGVGSRFIVGQSCFLGLMFLGQAMMIPPMWQHDIHFVDQKLIAAVFYIGTLILLPFFVNIEWPSIYERAIERKEKASTGIFLFSSFVLVDSLFVYGLSRVNEHLLAIGDSLWWLLAAVIVVQAVVLIGMFVRRSPKAGDSRLAVRSLWNWGFYVCMVVPLITYFTNPIWWPTTPARIQHHVESFQEGSYPFIDWRDWEIVASWTVETGLNPDLSHAGKLLDAKISEDTEFLRLILGNAFRVGMVRTDQLEGLAKSKQLSMDDSYAGFEKIRRSLLPATRLLQPHSFTRLSQRVWAIYALDQSDQLSSEDRDFLEQKLLATLNALDDQPYHVLEIALLSTQLLEVIDRPVDRDLYRERVQEWLRELHCQKPPLYQIAGGFREFKTLSSSSLKATSHAIELMEIYGIPEGLDLNWVRSYLRPLYFRPTSHGKWIAAVSLNRLNSLPGATQPTWLEMLYYERSLIAAMVLVMLCLYATSSSPKPADLEIGSPFVCGSVVSEVV